MNPIIFNLKIISCEEIRKSHNGKEYRHITFEDIQNYKTIDYVIFKKDHQYIWEDILGNDFKNIIYTGRIIRLKLTKDLISKVNIHNHLLTIKEGDDIEIVECYWNGWDNQPEDIRILWSLKEQLWKFRSFPRKRKHDFTNSDSDLDNDY